MQYLNHFLCTAVLIITFLCTGCATPPRTGPATVHTFETADSAQYAGLVECCERTLRDRHYAIDRVDPRTGFIKTKPETSGQFFEFWRHDTATSFDAWEATFLTVRRSVTVEAEFDAEQATTQLTVTVDRERYAKPERQFNHTMAAFRMFSDTLPSEETGRPTAEQDDYWIPSGRDPALEQDLLDEIIARLST